MMGFNKLKQELGDSLTTSEVAALLGVERRTVQKYPERYGGVWGQYAHLAPDQGAEAARVLSGVVLG